MDDNVRPSRDELVRARPSGSYEVQDTGNGRPRLVGYLAVFDEWAEINSVIEGHFMERIAAGAFSKTFRENRERMRVLFHHGQDQQVGVKVLGPIEVLEENETGAYYEVPLLDTKYNEELLPGLKAGLYGSSFFAKAVKTHRERRPQRADHNPDGLPEHTHQELRVFEFGPTPLATYAGATAVARSLTDEFASEDDLRDRLERIHDVARSRGITVPDAPPVRVTGDTRAETAFRRSVDYVGEAAWAITPGALATILAIIGERQSGYKPSAEEIRERIGVRRALNDDAGADSPVAVIRVDGPIIPRANLMSDISGGASAEMLQKQIHDAAASADVAAILLDIDSPGGAAALIPELAQEILAARAVKPVVAVANTLAASAAYWIASAATEIVVTPSGRVGSIGVYSAHSDISAAQEKMGVKTTLVSAGEYKVEKNPYEPLSDDARAEMQREIDAVYEMFLSAVAKGRDVSVKDVREKYGQGRVLLAKDALAVGMVDRIATFDQTLARLEKQAGRTSTTRSQAPPEPEPSAATTRTIEPERSVATTRTAPIWGSEDAPYWRL